jgi:hypothetical protein
MGPLSSDRELPGLRPASPRHKHRTYPTGIWLLGAAASLEGLRARRYRRYLLPDNAGARLAAGPRVVGSSPAAGFDEVVGQVGGEHECFFEFYAGQVLPRLREG